VNIHNQVKGEDKKDQAADLNSETSSRITFSSGNWKKVRKEIRKKSTQDCDNNLSWTNRKKVSKKSTTSRRKFTRRVKASRKESESR